MDQTIFNRIKNVLDESGLLSNVKTIPQFDVDFNFSNETILITGAAGTIGSCITRQLLNYQFKQIILLDNAETPLYYLQKELEGPQNTNFHFILSDIRDDDAMTDLFQTFQPSIIFHTAAYKHVALMENNPYEAVRLNIFGTKRLADLALLHQTKKFVFISTDKAANPIGVMGMTKSIAERYLEGLNTMNETTFLITRFGNVLGSNGSLIPLFKKQLKDTHSITVTSNEVSRYFITEDKACYLILKIVSIDNWDAHVFTFNMGDPIKIIDLANTLITLYHKKKDVSINFIGLRPGEKMHEDMISNTEELKSTTHQDIYCIVPKLKLKPTLINLKVIQDITPYQKAVEIKTILANFNH